MVQDSTRRARRKTRIPGIRDSEKGIRDTKLPFLFCSVDDESRVGLIGQPRYPWFQVYI